MASLTRRWWYLVAAVLAIASAASLALLTSGKALPSVARDPIFAFVQPGVTVWWFLLGGPFQTVPTSVTGITLAAGANAALWLLVLWLGVTTLRLFVASPRDHARERHELPPNKSLERTREE